MGRKSFTLEILGPKTRQCRGVSASLPAQKGNLRRELGLALPRDLHDSCTTLLACATASHPGPPAPPKSQPILMNHRLRTLLCFCACLMALAGAQAIFAQAAPSFAGADLYRAGQVILAQSTATATSITQPELRYMAQAVATANLNTLDNVNDDNLYYVGYALLSRKPGYLELITDPHWRALAQAVIIPDPAALLTIPEGPLRALGQALSTQTMAPLNPWKP